MAGTFNALIGKTQADGAVNNCEIWMQGPEPYATKVTDVVNEIYLLQGLQLDTWYDFYAKAQPNEAGGYGYFILTANLPGFPQQPNNPEVYHIWSADNASGNWDLVRNTFGLYIKENATPDIPAGQTGLCRLYMGRIASEASSASKPNPCPPYWWWRRLSISRTRYPDPSSH